MNRKLVVLISFTCFAFRTVSQEKLFWSENGMNPKISMADPDGSNPEIILDDVINPYGIAIDPTENFLYWCEAGSGKIQRSKIDGSQKEDVISGLSFPFSIVVASSMGKIYWTDRGTRKIQRANLDGTNPETIIDSIVFDPVDLAIDSGQQKIYFSDFTKKIISANLDGTNPVVVLFPIPGYITPARISPILNGNSFYSGNSNDSQNITGFLSYDGNISNLGDLPANSFANFLLYHQSTTDYIYFSDSINNQIQRTEFPPLSAEFVVGADKPQGIATYPNSSGTGANSNSGNIIAVFPNPAHESITITLPSVIEISSYEIFDLLGRRIQDGKIVSQKQEISLITINKGFYFLKIWNTKIFYLKNFAKF